MQKKNNNYLDFLASFGMGAAHPGGFPLTKEILENEELDKNSKVLDVGCGTGLTSAYISKTFSSKVIGLDNHPVMIQKAKERIKRSLLNVEIINGNAEHLPFSDCTFDFVIVESVTIFTSSIKKSIQEFERVLKPNGVLIDLEMTCEQDLLDGEKEEIKNAYEIKEVLTENDWKTLLQTVGFDSIETITGGAASSGRTIDNLSEINLSETNLNHFSTWLKHQEVMQRYANKLGYRVYRASKRSA